MPKFRLYRHVTDLAGNVKPFSKVAVRAADSELLAHLFQDRAGSKPLPNPLTTDDRGLLNCFVEAGEYDLYVVGGGQESGALLGVLVGIPPHSSPGGVPASQTQLLTYVGAAPTINQVVVVENEDAHQVTALDERAVTGELGIIVRVLSGGKVEVAFPGVRVVTPGLNHAQGVVYLNTAGYPQDTYEEGALFIQLGNSDGGDNFRFNPAIRTH